MNGGKRVGKSIVSLCGVTLATLFFNVQCRGELPREGRLFSDLSIQQQRQKRLAIEPPPTGERRSPYSTPMYYLLAEGFQDGIGSMNKPPSGNLVLDRNRPDLQEQLLKDWAELGLASTLFLATPSQWANAAQLQAIEDYVRLSRKHGLKVAVRLAGDSTLGGVEASGWEVHPRNPGNRISEYLDWVRQAAITFKGQVDHYILGDEVNANSWEMPVGDGQTQRGIRASEESRWTPSVYMELFTQVSELIKSIDPRVKLSMFGMGGFDIDYVRELYELDFSRYGDGIAANVFDSSDESAQRFIQMVRSYDPDVRFYSNGVGYVASSETNNYPSNTGSYLLYDEHRQAVEIARIMFTCFDAGWDSAPYYIAVRQWVLPDGQAAPHWYGFFGFQDLVLDSYGNMSIKRYPAWYAFQTIAWTFYDRPSLRKPGFDIICSETPDMFRAYERHHRGADEFLMVFWNRDQTHDIDIEIKGGGYLYPVQVNLFNHQNWKDVPYQLVKDGVKMSVEAGQEPVIIRMVKLKR